MSTMMSGKHKIGKTAVSLDKKRHLRQFPKHFVNLLQAVIPRI